MAYLSFRRFLELLLPEVAASALCSLFIYLDILPAQRWIILLPCIFMTVAYFVLQFRLLRICCMCTDVDTYIPANLIASGAFILVNVLCYALMDSVLYTWVFAIFKTLRYMQFLNTLLSAVAFQALTVLLVFVAPLGCPSMEEIMAMEEEESRGSQAQ